jgi:hypothetical protein
MVWSEGNMSLKRPVKPPGIDPGTVRLVAQRLNHTTTPGPLLSSTEVENDLLNAKHKRIPSESTDSCQPVVLLSVLTSDRVLLHSVEQGLCVFSSHCLCVHCINLHQLNRSQTDMPNSSFCTALIFVLSHAIPSDQQTVLRYKM